MSANGLTAGGLTRPNWIADSQTPDETARLCAQWELIRSASVLIVDDEPANIALLTDMLQAAQYTNVSSLSDARGVLAFVANAKPDIILLDLMMPGFTGIEVIEQLKTSQTALDIEIIVLTADVSSESKRHALRMGARDFLTKPFDVMELLLRIENVLETRFLRLELENNNANLERRVIERTASLQEAQQRVEQYAKEIENSHSEMLERLAVAGEYRDDDTGSHTLRVAYVSALLAADLGLEPDCIRWIAQAARLHDVGKIGIPDNILLKPGKLTAWELKEMRAHAEIGAKLFGTGQSELIRMASRIAKAHHEKWDGTGYPERLRGTDIPIEARIVAVADVFDALTHSRPYKKAWPVAEAVAEIKAQSGKHFDPEIVDFFLKLPHEELI